MKVVINSCYGRFGLSHQAVKLYAERCGLKLLWKKNGKGSWQQMSVKPELRDYPMYYIEGDASYWNDDDISRHDVRLVAVVEELGVAANDSCAVLHIVEIPDGTEYVISEYSGAEIIKERKQND